MDQRIKIRHGTNRARSQNNTTTGRTFETHTRDAGGNQSDKMMAVRTGQGESAMKSNAGLVETSVWLEKTTQVDISVEEQTPEAERKANLRPVVVTRGRRGSS